MATYIKDQGVSEMATYIDVRVACAEVDKGDLLVGNNAEWAKEIITRTPKADVVPRSEEGAECPTCHGTGRIGTTDWLIKNISKKQLAKEKAEAIAEHELHIKQDYARELFAELEFEIAQLDFDSAETRAIAIEGIIAELKKEYTERSE